MYSRYGNDPKRPVRLPEHYGGSAFSQQPTAPITIPKREPTRPLSRDGIEEKASPVADRLLRADRPQEKTDDILPDVLDVPDIVDEIVEEKEEEKEKNEKTPTPPEKPSFTSPINFAGLRRLLGGKDGGSGDDQDRLLLLGLILLLSRTEGESDILLWLSLLLLCG